MGMCWVPDCKHYNIREACKFFTFSKCVKERTKWIRSLRRNEKPGLGVVICSCHFRDGVKSNGPEIFAHNVSKKTQFLITSPEKRKRKQNCMPKKKDSPSSGSTELAKACIFRTQNWMFGRLVATGLSGPE